MILTDWILFSSTGLPHRAGAIHSTAASGSFNGTLGLTSDSDFGSGPDANVRVYRVDGRHWMPPVIAGKMYDAATWSLKIRHNGEFGLVGSWDESWQAGTFTQVIENEARTVIANNAPGWQSISDALGGLRHRMPEPDEDTFATLNGFGGLEWTLESFIGSPAKTPATLVVSCQLGIVAPAWHATAPPNPEGQWDPDDLEAVWWVSMAFSGRAYAEGAIVSQTFLGTFDGHEIGQVGYQEDDWTLELSIANTHSDP